MTMAVKLFEMKRISSGMAAELVCLEIFIDTTPILSLIARTGTLEMLPMLYTVKSMREPEICVNQDVVEFALREAWK